MKKKNNKPSTFIMRMSDERKNAIKAKADEMGLSLTQFADLAFDTLLKMDNNKEEKQDA